MRASEAIEEGTVPVQCPAYVAVLFTRAGGIRLDQTHRQGLCASSQHVRGGRASGRALRQPGPQAREAVRGRQLDGLVGDFAHAVTYADLFFLFPFQCVVLKTKTVRSCFCLGPCLGSELWGPSLLPTLLPLSSLRILSVVASRE